MVLKLLTETTSGQVMSRRTLTAQVGSIVPGKPFCMPDDGEEVSATPLVRSARYGTAEAADATRHRDLGEGHAAGWCLRQQGAAEKLSILWRAALPLRGLPRGYGDWGSKSATLTEDEIEECQAAWNEYDLAMSEVDRQCGPRHAAALRMVVVYSEPSTLDTAWRVRESLTWLADHWGLDDFGFERR